MVVIRRSRRPLAVGRLNRTTALVVVLLAASSAMAQEAQQTQADKDNTELKPIVLSAGQQLKQMPGVSVISRDDLEKNPVTNDISEIIRKMPGVNLTGTTSTGQRGNQRQIDIRGMGPENTLILIDGKPVLSRNSVRMGRGGERDSRGDSNWVPAEAIDHIEVIRGPAAARYGSGAAGGVVNIITREPEKWTSTVSIFGETPEHKSEGTSWRTTATTGGKLTDRTSIFLMGSYNRTSPDAYDINSSVDGGSPVAGREGVINKDVRGKFKFDLDAQNSFDIEGGYSRQGNLYAGDSQLSVLKGEASTLVPALYGQETNSLTRYDLSVTHHGNYDFGDSLSYLQWERTLNKRLGEGLTGGIEGAINTEDSSTIQLDNVTGKTEWNIPFTLGVDQTATLGAEFRGEYMDDSASITQTTGAIVIPGTSSDPANRDPKTDKWDFGLYTEDNLQITDDWTVTPGLRFDYDTSFGTNFSPSLNTSYAVTSEISIKGGIARAFKAPNLFQLNPNYVYKSAGNGCPVNYTLSGGYSGYSSDAGCYVVGNPDLDAETSWNKEIGINYNDDGGINTGLTYFRNDYHNKIQAGTEAYGGDGSYYYFKWDNIPRAVVSGLEGNFSMPVGEQLTASLNATYMIESKNKSDNQPLSLVPKYTLNAGLDWKPIESATITLSGTYYGKISPATVNSSTGKAIDAAVARDAYAVANINVKYDVNDHFSVSAGVKNMFDKRLLRSGDGANSYNEPGRSFYLGLNTTF
ncbi:FepA family TonB-dependent siderophore receptor [Neorhizobium sp. NCHU2750]|uniref:FepA family TonB-dependent siderophore receptor n=1 Tax=Neorhizobium sp. NCHU2750 TaxID=1825976 RepID=UPI000E768296|nr:ferric enterobactin receptor [Neorhizobium sp. NCHU2750]